MNYKMLDGMLLLTLLIINSIINTPVIIALLVCSISPSETYQILLGVFFFMFGLNIGKATELL